MGTRFRLFVQPPYSDSSEPEVITVSSPAGSVRAGPSDDLMYVVEPVGKRLPYGVRRTRAGKLFNYLPPWNGRTAMPAMPGPEGHFDHYDPSMPGFAAQHVFGCVRFTLDVWERYLGQPLEWHFRKHFERLEIAILPGWDNAQFGYGFLEVGSERMHQDWGHPFSLDFDVIAHEVGHALTYSLLGHPRAWYRVRPIWWFSGSLRRHGVADCSDALSIGRGRGTDSDAWQPLSRQPTCAVFRNIQSAAVEDGEQHGHAGGFSRWRPERARTLATVDRRAIRHPGRHFS